MFAKQGVSDAPASRVEWTANQRFKRTFGHSLSVGIILATAFHFALFRFFPALTAADVSFAVTEMGALDLPPEVEIPPAPEHVERPAIPVIAEAELFEDVTIAPTTFEENPVEQLPPPPAPGTHLDDQPTFTPYTVAPRLRDRVAAKKILKEKYPKLLRDAGIGGVVVVWVYIDEEGTVTKCQVHKSCGNHLLDEAALEAAQEFAFTPAMNFDKRVPVWVQIPITFSVKDET